MKIIYKVGSLLDAPEKILAHGCNSLGVMGAGVALAIKEKYEFAYKTYMMIHELGGLKLGVAVWSGNPDYKQVVNCIIQDNVGNGDKQYVNYDALRLCLEDINVHCKEFKEEFVAMPKIGCGLAGGDWKVVSKIIEESFQDVTPVVYVLDKKELQV